MEVLSECPISETMISQMFASELQRRMQESVQEVKMQLRDCHPTSVPMDFSVNMVHSWGQFCEPFS